MFDFIVSDHFEYKARGGRLSQQVTSQRFGSGTRAFASNYNFNELGQPEAIGYPVCLEWPCENNAPQRTVNLSYTKGFLTEVENFASLSYQLGGAMVHEINHSNGVKWTQIINTSDRQARPSNIGTTSVAGGANWSTGTYDYDSAWNIHQIGNAQFRYDRFHRLVQGQVDFNGLKSQSAVYDSYGNLTSLNTNGSSQNLSPNSTTNRLTGGMTEYDAAGNNTKLALGGITYEYGFDASGQMEFLKSSANQAKVFFYDAADERLMTWDCPLNSCGANSAFETWTLRGLGAEVLRVFEGKSSDTLIWKEDYVHRGGKTLAAVRPTATGGEETFAIHLDHLGSTRQVTNSFGAEVERHHYYPFGEEATIAQVPDLRLKYTGHERDRNGGGKGQLDYMHARSCSPVTGRFLSVADLNVPQSWNRYSYVGNSPLQFVDPDGRTRLMIVHPLTSRRTLEFNGMVRDELSANLSANVPVVGGVLAFLVDGVASIFPRNTEELNMNTLPLPAATVGSKLEQRVASALGGRLIKTNRKFVVDGVTRAEIDLETSSLIIEVTGGNGKGKMKQYVDNLSAGKIGNPDGKEVVIFAPEIGLHARRKLETLGVKIFRSIDELTAYVDKVSKD